MANPALEDQALLQGLFQAPFSPLQNYGTGLIAVATAMRQREQELQDAARRRSEQVSDITRQEGFTLQRDRTSQDIQAQRDFQQQKFQERLQQSSQRAAERHQKAQFDESDKERKEKIIMDLEGEASRLGIPIPDKSLPFDTRFQRLNSSTNADKSKAVVTMMQSIGQTENEISSVTGTEAKDRLKLGVNLLFSQNNSEYTKFLTQGEIQDITKDPEKIFDALRRLSQSKNKKEVQAFRNLNNAWNEAQAAALDESMKRKTSPEIKERLMLKRQTQMAFVSNLLKDTTLGPGAVMEMFGGIRDTAKSYQQERTSEGAPPLPGSSRFNQRTGGGSVTIDSATGGVVSPVTSYPDRASPSSVLNSYLRSEMAGAPAGGTAFRGLGATSTPVLDRYGEVLGNRLGLPQRQVGSSVFNRPRILDIMSNRALLSQLNRLPPEESDRLALETINQSAATVPRLQRFISDRAEASAALTPTAYSSGADQFSSPLFTQPFSPGLQF